MTVPVPGTAVPGMYETAAFWNANVRDGLSFLLNPPIFHAYASALQTIPNNTVTNVTLDTEVIDTAGGHSTTTNTDRYVCQVPGVYQVSGLVTFDSGNTTGLRLAEIRVNGSTAVMGSEVLAPASASQAIAAPTPPMPIRLAVGDYVTLSVLQSSGGSLAIGKAGGATLSTLFCKWIAA